MLLNYSNTKFHERLYKRPEIVNADSLIYSQSQRRLKIILPLSKNLNIVIVSITPFLASVPFCLYTI
jgi:hypothetical protein